MSFSLNIAASYQVDLATATQYAHRAFDAWNAVVCGQDGVPIGIQAKDAYGPVDCGHIEHNRIGGNANVILFRQDMWPYAGAVNALAFTTVTYDSTTGEIFDADMEINGRLSFIFPGVKGNTEEYDLLSIMTHEAGHFLGLAHSPRLDAVMQPTLDPDVVRTMLSADDIAGVCAIYPPGSPTAACDFAPQGGFSSQCSLGSVNGGACAVAPTPHEERATPLALLLPLAGIVPWALRRRERRAGVSPL